MKTVGGPPSTCDQLNAGVSSEDKTGQDLGKGSWKTEASSSFLSLMKTVTWFFHVIIIIIVIIIVIIKFADY